MTATQFRATLDRLDLTQVGAARLLGSDERTVRRWASGDRTIPQAVVIMLRLLVAKKITIEDIEAVNGR